MRLDTKNYLRRLALIHDYKMSFEILLGRYYHENVGIHMGMLRNLQKRTDIKHIINEITDKGISEEF